MTLDPAVDRLQSSGKPHEHSISMLRSRSSVRRERYAPDQAALRHAGGVARSCRHEPAASSRLASAPDDDLLGRVQLPALG